MPIFQITRAELIRQDRTYEVDASSIEEAIDGLDTDAATLIDEQDQDTHSLLHIVSACDEDGNQVELPTNL